jgi:hypothetical protein
MTYAEFNEKIKEAGLTNKAFSDILEIDNRSVNNWSQKGVPYWVATWLEYYIKAKKYNEIMERLK